MVLFFILEILSFFYFTALSEIRIAKIIWSVNPILYENLTNIMPDLLLWKIYFNIVVCVHK